MAGSRRHRLALLKDAHENWVRENPYDEDLYSYKSNLAGLLDFRTLFPWQRKIRADIKRYDYHLIVSPRQIGKTTLAADILTDAWLNGLAALYLSPSTAQTNIVWSEIRRLFRPIWSDTNLNKLFNKKFRMVLSPRTIETRINDINRILLQTTDKEEGVRGGTYDIVIMDEYAYQDETFYQEVVLPMLLVNNGKIVFLSTPPNPEKYATSKAKNKLHLIDLWNAKKDDPRWNTINPKPTDSPLVSKERLEEL